MKKRSSIISSTASTFASSPVQERAIVLVIDGIAGNVENLLLEFDEFIFELDLVHRTIVGLICVLFHAAKLRHEDAKEWQNTDSRLHLLIYCTSGLLLTKTLRVERLAREENIKQFLL